MNEPNTCLQEPLILAAIGSAMSEELSLHVKGCDSCQEAKALAEQMRHIATRRIAVPPPDPDILWVMAQLSKTPSPWTSETVTGIATLAASALLSVWMWPTITGYLSAIVPKAAETANPFLTSCVVAAAIAGVAAKTIGRMTGEGN